MLTFSPCCDILQVTVIYNFRKARVDILEDIVFNRTLKGYDPKQVDEFIIGLSDTYSRNEAELADKLRAAEAENERLREEVAKLKDAATMREIEHSVALADTKRESEALCTEIGEKMVNADKRASEIVRNAEKEAALIINDARRGSENEAKAIRARAEEEAARLVEETRRKCESITAAAEEFRARQNEMNKSLMESESRFNTALNKLREDIGED